MLQLDLQTLFTALTLAFLLVAGLTLLAAFYPRRSNALLWFFIAFLSCWAGHLVVLLTSDMAQNPFKTAFVILAHGLMWTGMRAFSDKPAHWKGLAAGQLIWLVICLSAGSAPAEGSRWLSNGYSLLITGYTLLALNELLPSLRERNWAVAPMVALLSLHGVYILARLWPSLDLQMIMLLDQLEALLFVIASGFAALGMVYAKNQLEYLNDSLHDTLTGLLNRRGLFRQRGQLQADKRFISRQNHGVALLMCDLDWFKKVNDQLGHDTGDQILLEFAHVLKQSTSYDDICARIGGEEFVVLALDISPQQARQLAQRIQKNLAKRSLELPLRQTVSIGLACFSSLHTPLEDMLRYSDKALYRAKNEGRDCVREWLPATLASRLQNSTNTHGIK